MIRSELSSSQRGGCVQLGFLEKLKDAATRVQIPKGTWTGLAEVLAAEIHGEARLAA